MVETPTQPTQFPQAHPHPRPLVDHEACSDVSSGFGIAITIGPKWRAWKLAPGRNSQERDILRAEAAGFELLILHLFISSEGEHLKVYGGNRGVVEVWWKKYSTNRPTNRVFRRILELSESCDRKIHTRYVPSARNPADTPSRGHYPPLKYLLDDFDIPVELRPFLISVGPSSSQNGRTQAARSSPKLYGVHTGRQSQGPQAAQAP
jgi:hypothetical protein